MQKFRGKKKENTIDFNCFWMKLILITIDERKFLLIKSLQYKVENFPLKALV